VIAKKPATVQYATVGGGQQNSALAQSISGIRAVRLIQLRSITTVGGGTQNWH